MTKLAEIWEAINGYKTWAGAALILLGYGVPYIGIPQNVDDACITIGTFLGGVGVLHKFYKAGQAAGQ